jgi:hypothetical protein
MAHLGDEELELILEVAPNAAEVEATPEAEWVVDEDRRRILARPNAKLCIHGRLLYEMPLHRINNRPPPAERPVYCAACDFELGLIERRPSER